MLDLSVNVIFSFFEFVIMVNRPLVPITLPNRTTERFNFLLLYLGLVKTFFSASSFDEPRTVASTTLSVLIRINFLTFL